LCVGILRCISIDWLSDLLTAFRIAIVVLVFIVVFQVKMLFFFLQVFV